MWSGPCICQRESAVASSHHSGGPFCNVGRSSAEDFVNWIALPKYNGHTEIKTNMAVTAQKLRVDASTVSYVRLSVSGGPGGRYRENAHSQADALTIRKDGPIGVD